MISLAIQKKPAANETRGGLNSTLGRAMKSSRRKKDSFSRIFSYFLKPDDITFTLLMVCAF
jgi:hypothetical protein